MLFSSLLLATTAFAAPLSQKRDLKPYVADFTIHESCSNPQQRMIAQGLKEALEVAAFAKQYITTNGASDPVFKLYFGDQPAAYPTAMGAYDGLISSNKEGVIFRCDDPDNNCKLPGWRGHWRGENATSETVICDASYTDRVFNAAFCLNGFVLAETKPSVYWSVDLIHRLYHIPSVANNAVAHYAEELGDVVALAEHNSTYSPLDSNAIQYFAAHVYALEVAKGGEACIGDIAGAHAHTEPATPAAPSAEASSSAAPPADTPAPAPAKATTPTPAAPAAEATGNDCHSHADGSVHCGSD